MGPVSIDTALPGGVSIMAAARGCLAGNGVLGVRQCACEPACQLTRPAWTAGGRLDSSWEAVSIDTLEACVGRPQRLIGPRVN